MTPLLAWIPAALLLLPFSTLNASNSGLHPLDQAIAAGTIEVTLRDAAVAGERLSVECVYRPYRERDVIKRRSFHLFGSPFRIGSGLFSVQRDEFHSVRQEVRPADTTIRFSVALRDPDAAHRHYQLDSVRLIGQRLGSIELGRWFPQVPRLDPGFGFSCEAEKLSGRLRPGGLGARPLTGNLPFWPTLRFIDLAFAPVAFPRIQLWDAAAKHHWDGWRQSTPQHWPGGSTIVARHVAAPVVWRSHSYFAFLPSNSPDVPRPVPPADAIPGVDLEVYWPEGERLEFPEVNFERPVDVLALPVARLTVRAREILAGGTTLRPGVEHGSMTTAEWEVLEALAVPRPEAAVAAEMKVDGNGRDVMEIRRNARLTEPWLLLFGVDYDEGRRVSLKAMAMDPGRWTGPLPE